MGEEQSGFLDKAADREKGRLLEISLCEFTGSKIESGRCPDHPDPELEADCLRRGIPYTAGCAARFVHNNWFLGITDEGACSSEEGETS